MLLLPRGTLSLLEGVWVSRTVSLLGVNDLISFASRAVKEMEGGDRPQAVDPCSERIPRMLNASCYKNRKDLLLPPDRGDGGWGKINH